MGEVTSTWVVGCGHADREALRIAVVGIVGPETQRGTVDDVILHRSDEIAVSVIGTHIVHEGIAHGEARTTMGKRGVVIATEVVAVVDPRTTVAVDIQYIPAVQAVFKVFGEGAAVATLATATTARQTLGIPHGPTSTGDIEIVNTVDDLGHYITKVGLVPDVDCVFNRIVSVEINLHEVIALAEAFPTVEACFVKCDGGHRVVGLFVFVQVDETHFDTFRTIGAVE